jgi:hypothetical protein
VDGAIFADAQTKALISQPQLNSKLRWAVVFSVVWLFGLGSAFAFTQALRARRYILESNGNLRGTGRVWWCLIVGAIGMVLWLPLLGIIIINQFR